MFRRLHGQSLVELALVAPILIVLVVAALDLGRIFASSISVTNSAREAASWGSQAIAGSISDASIRGVAAAEGTGARILPDATHVVIAYPSPDLIVVTVRSPFQPVVPLVGGLWAAAYTWRHRLALTHVLAVLLAVAGLALLSVQVLPRSGYARITGVQADAWRCALDDTHAA